MAISRDTLKFFETINNPNVKACQRLASEDYDYLQSLINSADKSLDDLEDKREQNKPQISALRDKFAAIPPEYLFQAHKSKMQKNLFEAMLCILDRATEIGFTDKFYLPASLLMK